METPLNATATTAGALISTSTFMVPPYQREYAWESDEIKDFWADLKSALGDESYFLGLVILTDQGGQKQVVDGQQRILTLTMLASAVYHEALRSGRNALADRLRADFLKSIDYETDDIRPRVNLSDERDNETFQRILDNPDSLDRTQHFSPESLSPKLISAFEELSIRLREDLDRDPFRRLGAWADFITNRIYLAVFVHPDEASAYRVFEVINTRGRELTTADLLKSYVLSQTVSRNRSQRYEEWQSMSRQFSSAGSNTLVQFIRHVVIVEAGYVLPRDLYDYLSRRLLQSGKDKRQPPTVDELMVSLEDWLPLYGQLMDPTSEGPAEADWLRVFSSLEDLGVISVRPMLLAISESERSSEGMRKLLRLVVRRIVVGNLGTGNVERRFSEAARKIKLQGSWDESLRDLDDLNPSRGDFVEQLRKRSLNMGTLAFLRRSVRQQTITPETSGTLHLIRPRQAPDWLDFPDDEFSYWGSTIGNTILTNAERRPRGSGTWDGFQTDLLVESLEPETTRRLESLGRWDAGAVEDAGRRIAEEAADIWYEND